VSIFSPVLNDPYQAAHPVLEDALDVIERRSSQTFVITSSRCVLTYQRAKVTWISVEQIAWQQKSGDVMLHEFRWTPKNVTLASEDENIGLPFSSPEKYSPRNIAECICDILVRYPERLVSLQ
jgi:hypothetical protein